MTRDFKTPITEKNIPLGYDKPEDTIILATETSCDETACAIVKNGREVLANVVATQIKTHRQFGGVVPEVAAREHLEAINLVIDEAFSQSGLSPDDITAIASTQGPGLVGALLVGFNAAKALSVAYDKPFMAVNHLKGHVCANYLDTELKPPFVALLVSGGHTQIIKVDSYENQEIIGETIDDAVGEAYDKVARLMGLEYPGGPNLDKLAQKGDPKRFKFTEARVGEYDFSFSGLKTAMLRLIQSLEKEGGELPKEDISASFQEVVSAVLLKKTLRVAEKYGIKTLALAGGVAANSEIRRKFFEMKEQGYEVYAPPMRYCTDNAAMIASAAYFLSNVSSDLDAEVFSRA
jgi:N6-L-threonylcarbamoyladenine synthase